MTTTEMTGDRNDRDQNDQTSLPTQMTATVLSPTLMTATKMTGHDLNYLHAINSAKTMYYCIRISCLIFLFYATMYFIPHVAINENRMLMSNAFQFLSKLILN